MKIGKAEMWFAGWDGGFGGNKLKVSKRDGAVISLSFPSVVGNSINRSFTMNDANKGCWINDKFVGELAILQLKRRAGAMNVLGRERSIDDVKVMMYSAFVRAGITGNVVLTTGLPSSWYGGDKSKLAALKGTHRFIVDGETTHEFTVVSLNAMPQPVGGYYSLILDKFGNVRENDYTTGTWLMTDIGWYTADFSLISGGQYVELGTEASLEHAMSSVGENAAEVIESTIGIHVDPVDRMKMCRDGYVKDRGKQKSVSSIVAQAAREEAVVVTNHIRSIVGDAREIDGIIVVGGGAPHMIGTIKGVYDHAVMPSVKEPEMKNAEGFHNWSCRVSVEDILAAITQV